MSNYTSTANLVLTVNGKQAQMMISTLEKQAKELEKDIAAAAAAGDKVKMKSLQRELNQANRLMDQIRGSAASTERVLSRLDKATPKELNKTLRQLKNELNGIERGSEAWNAHIAKIKALKAEMSALNEEMNPDEGFWDKLNGYWEKFQLGITAAAAALVGLIAAGKSAVSAFAEMEQEMANVRKFTGMEEEEVLALNEAFKGIDTRTPREELNKLAQEAGRLGKTSQEDVLGFVRAADKINVALDDLGKGATLTLSKLTGIFGDEKRLGTERALLAVGSVINELSQNCSASAPYLAEFSSRMGGVGSQAGLTVQQIMGFASVLDANNQKIESSSTALSQVIVRIYQEPEKYARVAGMDVTKFTNLVKSDMNAALIEFLSTLKKAGNMDVLSPMFKDMGETGAGAIAALSTLANNIEMVKAQQIVANEAFSEAVSIDKEFEVQNNTVQAGLDKAKNRVHELAVELGEKLQPVMRLAISSTTVALKTLSTVVDFFIKYRSEIVSLSVTIGAYVAIMKLHSLWLSRVAINTVLVDNTTKLLAASQRMLSGVFAVVRLGAATLTNTFAYFRNGLQVTYSMQERWRKSMAAMSFGSWIGLLLALGTAVAMLWRHFKRVAEEAQFVQNIRKEAIKKMGAERVSIDLLVAAAKNEHLALVERQKAIDKLNKMIPGYNAHLDKTTGKYRANASALNDYITQLTRKYELEGAKEKLAEIGKEKADARIELDNAKRDLANAQNTPMKWGGGMSSAFTVQNAGVAIRNEAQARVNRAQAKYDAAVDKEDRILHVYKDDLHRDAINNTETETVTQDPDPTPDPTPDIIPPGTSSPTSDRFAAEKEWRERQEAIARIAYAKGETDYISHTAKMGQILVEYYDKVLKHTDLSETERLSFSADRQEALKKQDEQAVASTIEQEEKQYSARLAELKQFYLDGSISKETYDLKTEEAELVHQDRLVKALKEGTSERAKAEERYTQLRIAQMERRQAEARKKEEEMAALKKEFFGDNPAERQAQYSSMEAALTEVYNRELAAAGNNAAERLRIEEAYEKAKLAIRKKYGLLSEEATRSALERGVAKSLEWLDSEGAKAITGAYDTIVSGMSSIFSQLNAMTQADLEMTTAAISRRYDAEIAAAEGNSFKVRKLEKEKEQAIAKAKAEANRKMFAMQVIQAVAQTAQNAIAAYGSAAAIPVVGLTLAPIAAAMAMAAGMLQVATIKKQQQASEAQGYQSGGFTPKGKADEVAGVVHKGEWVASQALVNNPRTRPLLEALDYAQRNNTIGSISAADVSRSITAPAVMAHAYAPPTIVNNTFNTSQPADTSAIERTLSRLNDRLNEPFVTVNTVSGDHGIQRAQEEYERLMRNKSPKYRR